MTPQRDVLDPHELVGRLRGCGLDEIASELAAIIAIRKPSITMPPIPGDLTGNDKLHALNSYLKAAAYGHREMAADLALLDLILVLLADG